MTVDELLLNLHLVVPVLGALLALIVEGARKKSALVAYWITSLAYIVSFVAALTQLNMPVQTFGGMLESGGYAAFMSALFAGAGLVTNVLSRPYLLKYGILRSEFFVLTQLSVAGMILLAGALHLLIVFLGIELMSLILYILAGYMRTKPSANEASLKYFLLGSFATGFLIYGIALLYGSTGSLFLDELARQMPGRLGDPFFLLGASLLFIGLAFKVAAVPFHMWAPDVYQGAPTTVTGFMATAVKSAAFTVMVVIFMKVLALAGQPLNMVIAYVATASMILGNIAALAQNNLKRMLAYSSVGHAGYLLIGLASGNPEGKIGIIFYLVVYTCMNLGSFGILALVERKDESALTFDDYAGLSARQPALAAMMSIFMFSLAGIPPLGGFVGKYYLFLSAVKADMTWLAIVGVAASLVSVYYYIRLVIMMYFKEGDASVAESIPSSYSTALAACTALVVVLGIYPSLILDIVQRLF